VTTKRFLIFFGIVKSIPKDYCRTESYLEISSDHSRIIIIVNSKVITKRCTLYNIKRHLQHLTNYRYLLEQLMNIYFRQLYPFKNRHLSRTTFVQLKVLTMLQIARNAMPTDSNLDIHIEYSSTIKHKLAEESKLYNQSQTNRCLILKTKLNRVIKALKNFI